ncbi:hypothetical protein N9Y07_00045 [Alphaproteobacteria bacterium]|mgnify:CR=1 FL=1|nr:hypothetical protein [Alphaproteobacteria bacterium]
MKFKLQFLAFLFLHSLSTGVFACEAMLSLREPNGFVYRGVVGEALKYTQHVYSGREMSFSILVPPLKPNFYKDEVVFRTSKNMLSTVTARAKAESPEVKVLNDGLLSRVDERLEFLSYIEYGWPGAVNIEASSVIKKQDCWAILRFTGLGKESRDEAMDIFAALIRNTNLAD